MSTSEDDPRQGKEAKGTGAEEGRRRELGRGNGKRGVGWDGSMEKALTLPAAKVELPILPLPTALTHRHSARVAPDLPLSVLGEEGLPSGGVDAALVGRLPQRPRKTATDSDQRPVR